MGLGDSFSRNLGIAASANLALGGDPRLSALFGAASLAFSGTPNPWGPDLTSRLRGLIASTPQLQTPTTPADIVQPAPYIPYQDSPAGNPGGVPVSVIPFGAGIGQQTLASRLMMAKASGRKGGKKSARRRKAKAKRSSGARRVRKTRKANARPRRLVKGSPAAKRYMAMLRNKRK